MDVLYTSNTDHYLLFYLAGENYAFDVVKTREVLFYEKVYPMPSAEDFIDGVINLRGSIIPVVNLRKKLGFDTIEPDLDTAIIIIEVNTGDELAVIGALVDGVKGVISCHQNQLEGPPKYGLKLDSFLVESILKREADFIVILNADAVLGDTSMYINDEAAGP